MQCFGNTSVIAAVIGPIPWEICISQLLPLWELSYPSCTVFPLSATDLIPYFSSSQESCGNIWRCGQELQGLLVESIHPLPGKHTQVLDGPMPKGLGHILNPLHMSGRGAWAAVPACLSPALPALLTHPSWRRMDGHVSVQICCISLARNPSNSAPFHCPDLLPSRWIVFSVRFERVPQTQFPMGPSFHPLPGLTAQVIRPKQLQRRPRESMTEIEKMQEGENGRIGVREAGRSRNPGSQPCPQSCL